MYAGLGDAALHARRFSRLRKKAEYGKILWYNECCHRDVGASMRGGDRNTGALFSYVSCEARVAKSHPLRAIRQIVDAALLALSPDFRGAVRQAGAAINPAREAASSAVTAGVLFGAFGAAADGAARLQSAVPLVCRPVDHGWYEIRTRSASRSL